MSELINCIRCRGYKKLYKVNNGYVTTNIGGEHVICPLCNGEGRIKSLEEELKEKNSANTTEDNTPKSETVELGMPIRGPSTIELPKKRGRPAKQK